MLTEERYTLILRILEIKKSASISILSKELKISESTVRRDLNALSEMGKLIKVYGGATVLDSNFIIEERSVKTKSKLFVNEKTAIAKYAASTIKSNDFIYIDSGTTTERMIDFITSKNITVVTNGFTHAKKLSMKGINCYVVGGLVKGLTEAIVGSECVRSIHKYNFSKCYMGTNGIDINAGFSTPDLDEANVKTAACEQSQKVFVLADHSKFDNVTAVKFADIRSAKIITDKVPNDIYKTVCMVEEVL